jgi:hypothetical protein
MSVSITLTSHQISVFRYWDRDGAVVVYFDTDVAYTSHTLRTSPLYLNAIYRNEVK